MRIQNTETWNDPLVQETLAGVAELHELADRGDINDHPVMKVLLQTECLDPLAVAMVIGMDPYARDAVPSEVRDALDLAEAERVRENGPGHLFMAGNVSAIRFVLAEFASEATGEGYKQLLARPDLAEIKPHIEAAAENVVALADGLMDSGLWRDMPPKLLDKFIESMENVKSMTGSSILKRGIASTVSAFKTVIAEGNAQEMTEVRAPCIDPSSQYMAMKQIARTKFLLH
jgi:hypothetical protein